jgi:hypothetical protein
MTCLTMTATRLKWGKSPFIPRWLNPYSYFDRLNLNETVMAERSYIQHLDSNYFEKPAYSRTDVTLFITRTPAELRKLAVSRSPAAIVKSFIEALVNKDIEAIAEHLRRGVQLDFPLRRYENLLHLAKDGFDDPSIVDLIGSAIGNGHRLPQDNFLNA